MCDQNRKKIAIRNQFAIECADKIFEIRKD